MNLRAVLAVLAALGVAGCSGSSTGGGAYHPRIVDEGGGDGPRVGGGRFARTDVEKAIAAEKELLAGLDQKIAAEEDADAADADAPVRLAALRADRTAGASFVAQLEACLATPDDCPPSLDEPQVATDFDAATGEFKGALAVVPAKWPEVSAQLEVSACGCRTSRCVQWVVADLDRWEAALSRDVQADEIAAAHVTGARECLWARIGKRAHRTPVAPSE